MTRGKHGAAAAVRHEVQSAAEQIETYKRAVVRLTQERNEAREALAAEKARNAETERLLAVERDHGVSPKVQALELRLAKAREENDEYRRRDVYARQRGDRRVLWMVDHLEQEHGLTRTESSELLLSVSLGEVPGGPRTVTLHVDHTGARKLPLDGVRAVQRARGARS